MKILFGLFVNMLPLVGIIGVIIVFLWFIKILLVKPDRILLFWGLVFLCQVLQYSLPIKIPLITQGVNFVFISLFMPDIIFMLIFVTLLVSGCNAIQNNNLVIRKTPGYKLILFMLVFTSVCLINAIAGLPNFTDTNWLADMRNNFRFIMPIIYLYWYRDRFEYTLFEKVAKMVLIIAMFYAFLLWGLYLGAGLKITPQTNPFRVIGPQQMIVYAYGALFYMFKDLFIDKRYRLSFMTLALSLCVLIDQYRTVWLSFFAGFFMIIFSYMFLKKINRSDLIFVIQMVTIVAVGILFIATNTGELAANINTLQNSFGNLEDSSWKTRTDLWKALIGNLNGIEVFIGQPFGSGYDGGIGWKTSPHSGWMEILMRSGIVGTVSIALVLLGCAIKCHESKVKILVRAFVVAQIVFLVGYSFTIDTGFIIGLCMIELYRSNYLLKNL